MNWIKPDVPWTTLILVALGGCATQETLLPTSERKMADIYREAMSEVAAPVAPNFDPEVICDSLELDESTEACQATLEAHAARVYGQIDGDTAVQPLDYVAYTRTVEAELDNLFPRLENPDLVIYVYPHLATRTRAPIPGYTTVLPLYERVEYRLPGEALLPTPRPVVPEAGEGTP